MRKEFFAVGQQVGNFIFLHDVEHVASKRRRAMFQCVCGTRYVLSVAAAKMNYIISCGCLRDEKARITQTTHGRSGTPEYYSWSSMKARCLKPNHENYHNYGGRGITICDRWLNSFDNFLADIGTRPTNKHTLDRIDVNGNYEPSNCRWATAKEQAQNRRTSIFLPLNGVVKTVEGWSKQTGLSKSTIYRRIQIGWDAKKTLYTPLSSLPKRVCTFKIAN